MAREPKNQNGGAMQRMGVRQETFDKARQLGLVLGEKDHAILEMAVDMLFANKKKEVENFMQRLAGNS